MAATDLSTLVPYFILVGFFAAGTTHAARAVAPQPWLMHKPLACDLCMSWWSSWLGVLLMSLYQPLELFSAGVVVLAAVGLSVLLLKLVWRLGE